MAAWIAACAVEHVAPQAVVVQERHPRVVVRVVSDQVSLVGDPLGGRGLRLGPAPLHEERRSNARVPERVEDVLDVAGRAPGTVRMLGVERQRDTQERSVIHGSSPSTPGRTTRAGGPGRRRASMPGAARGGRTRRERASGPACRCRSATRRRGYLRPPRRPRALAPSATSSPDRPTSRSRVSGSVAMTIAASAGPASSRGPWRNWAVWRDSIGIPTASFSVSAPISAAARAGPRPRMTELVRSPSQVASSSARSGVGEQALERAGGRAGRSIDLDDRRRRRLAPQHPAHSRQHDEGGRERHGRGPDLLSRSRVEDDVGQSGERVARPVGDRDDERRAVGPREPLDQADDLGALTRLAHRDEQPGAWEQVPAEVQQLGRVDVQGRHARGRERRHRRVAGVVRAPHPGEDDGPFLPGLRRSLERGALVGEAVRRSPDRVGLARDLRDEWVRKLS